MVQQESCARYSRWSFGAPVRYEQSNIAVIAILYNWNGQDSTPAMISYDFHNVWTNNNKTEIKKKYGKMEIQLSSVENGPFKLNIQFQM